MSENFNAFDISPVPQGPNADAPEPFRGIYAMPMFVTIPTTDLAASTDFWTRGLGFVDLFSIPGQVVHLRRWAFQDVLLVPGSLGGDAQMQVSFSAVLGQLDEVAAACRALAPESVVGPIDRPWSTRDLEVGTPEGARVVLTAAKPFDPESAEAKSLAAVGITHPEAEGEPQ